VNSTQTKQSPGGGGASEEAGEPGLEVGAFIISSEYSTPPQLPQRNRSRRGPRYLHDKRMQARRAVEALFKPAVIVIYRKRRTLAKEPV
jgi:hypothetical protein